MSEEAGGQGGRADGAEFRRRMALWPTGVAVVTTREGALDFGLTVNALLSVALTPPTLLVSLDRFADSTPVVERSGGFAVSFLSAEQRERSERFARAVPSREKFRDLPLHRSRAGRVWLDGALAAFDCRVIAKVPAADHVLFVGEVIEQEGDGAGRPLVFHRSGYTTVAGERL